MKIFNTNKRREWNSYGIRIESNLILMSFYSEIKTTVRVPSQKCSLVIISKNIIGDGKFFIEISSSNIDIRQKFNTSGIKTFKSVIDFISEDEDITIKIYRDKSTSGKILINGIYIYNLKEEEKEEAAEANALLYDDVKAELLSGILPTTTEDAMYSDFESNESIIDSNSSIITVVNNELEQNIDKKVDTSDIINSDNLIFEEKIKNEERPTTIDNPMVEVTYESNQAIKKIKKSKKNNNTGERLLEIASANEIIKLEPVLTPSSSADVEKKEERVIQKKEKNIVSIFDLDLIEDENDLMRYSSQISFGKKNNKFFIKNSKNFVLKNIKNIENVKMFSSFEDIIKELSEFNFDKIICDKSIDDAVFIDNLEKLKSSK